MKERGFILMIMLFLLLLLAVTSISLNMKSGMQAKMSVNQSLDVQSYFSQLAVIEQSVWKLAADPSWRVPGGENITYPDPAVEPDPQKRVIYNRTVANSLINLYTDTIVMSVRSPNATRALNKSFRYNIDTPFLIRTPREVCLDSVGNVFFADTANHSIWKIDAFTDAIIRVAGTGVSGFSGDGGLATQAKLDSPRGVWVDGVGNVHIADTNNNRIRKVSAGMISTVAGNGTTGTPLGVNGDGGPATVAQINGPRSVFVDSNLNIFIADTGNNRIRKVSAGIISTVAGNGATGTPLGVDGDGGPATAAQINGPRSVFVDSNLNIFIADTGNNRIRKFTVGGNISTVAGNGATGTPLGVDGDGGAATAAQISGPRSVFVDSNLNIFIADTGNNRIRKVSAGIISTVAGNGATGTPLGDNGPATSGRIDAPNGVCVRSTGEMIISDTGNSCLRKVITNIISTLPMTAGPGLNTPKGVAAYYDAGQIPKKLFLYIADQGHNRIRKLDTVTNAIVTVAGTGGAGSTGDNGLAVNATLNSPTRVAIDVSGNIYIADTGNHRIRRFTDGGSITTVAGTSRGLSGDGGAATAAQLDSPQGVFVDVSGNIYIADTANHRIRKFTVGGNITTVAGTSRGLSGDGGAATAAQLDSPQGVFADVSGNIYIADTGNHRIRKFTVGGNISTVAGTTVGFSGDGGAATAAKLNTPQGVTVDAQGNIYIADAGNHALRFVNHSAAAMNAGAIRTLAGIGTTRGYNGDLRPAVQAQLDSPGGIALGLAKGAGRIYISDSGNDRIRVLFLKTVKEVYGP